MNSNFTLKRMNSMQLAFCFLFFLSLFSNGITAQNSCAEALPVQAGQIYNIQDINGSSSGISCQPITANSRFEWYVYTTNVNKTVTVTSDLEQNRCKDTRVTVLSGVCGALVCVGTDDDSGVLSCNNGSNTNSYLSTYTFHAVAGVNYYIGWDNRYNASNFDFVLTETNYQPGICEQATTITNGTYTIDAINQTNLNTSCSTAANAKWFKYTAAENGVLTISSDLPQNACIDTNLIIYTGNCNTGLICNANDDNSGIVICSNNGSSNLSVKAIDVFAGTSYYIVWDSKNSVSGFDFKVSLDPVVLPITYQTEQVAGINTTYNIGVVDMNNDGLDDLIGVNQGRLRLHYQGANGFTFQDFEIPGNSHMPTWSLAAGDYNKDGYNDLVLGGGQGLSMWYSNETGTAYSSDTPPQYIFCQRTNFIDINNDGNLDIFSCHDIDKNTYFINDGTTNLSANYRQSDAQTFGTIGGNYASLWFDYNNDGLQDLFISKCSGPPCELYRNNGDSTFSNVAAVSGLNFQPVQSWSSAIQDFDNDGDMDIIVGSNGGSVTRMFRNEWDTQPGSDLFTNVTTGSGWNNNASSSRDYISYDFDNDGNMDVIGGGNRIMFGNGDGTFRAIAIQNVSVSAVGDLNNDGFLDFYNGGNIVYAQPNGNHWIKVVLRGIQSNRNGIGARVEINGAFGKRIRDIRSGEGFEFMSTLNAHFGIGQHEAITSLVVRWPSGVVDVIENPSIDSVQNMVEGQHPLSTAQITDAGFKIYPNPTKNILNISSSAEITEVSEVAIFDITGRMVAKPNLVKQTISVSDLSAGTYILLIRDKEGKGHTQKFIKN